MAKVMGNLRISLFFLLLFLTSALLYVASAEAGQGRVYPSCSNNATGRTLSDACLQTTDVRYQTPLPTRTWMHSLPIPIGDVGTLLHRAKQNQQSSFYPQCCPLSPRHDSLKLRSMAMCYGATNKKEYLL
jgi:hypothetical protein